MTRISAVTATVLLALVSGAKADEPDGKDTQYGPVVCHSVTFVTPKDHNARTWEGAVTRAINIALPNDTTICYDADRMTVASYWRGGFLDFSKTHHTSYKGSLPPRPDADPLYKDLEGAPTKTLGDDEKLAELSGYYLHDDRVVLSYDVGDRNVLESPTSNDQVIWRELAIQPGKDSFRMPL